MCNIPTKGYIYYSLGLKKIYLIGISWEPSFNKIRNILRHESREVQEKSEFFEATMSFTFSRPQYYSRRAGGTSRA